MRHCSVLMIDIAGSVALRSRKGEESASRIIRALLAEILEIAEFYGATFSTPRGDDLMLTFEGQDGGIGAAAQTAIASLRRSEMAGLSLYAGLATGEADFSETLGRPDVNGPPVNLSARLHKLLDGEPGHIFLPSDMVQGLSDGYRGMASPVGVRALKGFGPVEVWELAWRDVTTTITYVPTRNLLMAIDPELPGNLVLRFQGQQFEVSALETDFEIGRAANCQLRVPDPEPRISKRHMVVLVENGQWIAHDVSRNGTWLRDDASGEEVPLPPGNKMNLPSRGAICLGRPFSEDPAAIYVIDFERQLGS